MTVISLDWNAHGMTGEMSWDDQTTSRSECAPTPTFAANKTDVVE